MPPEKRQDLVKQLAFYGSYHSHPINILIHLIWVPIIEYCTICLLVYFTLPFPNLRSPYLNFATLYVLVVGTLTLKLDLKSGSLRCVILATFGYFAYNQALTANSTTVWTWIALKTLGWVLQVWVGHGMFEGRKPALLDNLTRALFSAPYFVLLEALFLLGFEKNLKKAVDEELAKKKLTSKVM